MGPPDKAKYLKFKFKFDPFLSLGNVKVQKRNVSIHSQFIARFTGSSYASHVDTILKDSLRNSQIRLSDASPLISSNRFT